MICHEIFGPTPSVWLPPHRDQGQDRKSALEILHRFLSFVLSSASCGLGLAALGVGTCHPHYHLVISYTSAIRSSSNAFLIAFHAFSHHLPRLCSCVEPLLLNFEHCSGTSARRPGCSAFSLGVNQPLQFPAPQDPPRERLTAGGVAETKVGLPGFVGMVV